MQRPEIVQLMSISSQTANYLDEWDSWWQFSAIKQIQVRFGCSKKLNIQRVEKD